MTYKCNECGWSCAGWRARCGRCNAFSLSPLEDVSAEVNHGAHRADAATVASAVAPTPIGDAPITFVGGASPPQPVSEPIRITLADVEIFDRIPTAMIELDRVLGRDRDDDPGGVVVGSVVLLGGEPGIGKSTLLIQALASSRRRVLYVSGEESIGQVALRARRVGAATDQIWIVAESDVDTIIAHARSLRPDLLAIDSIQTCVDAAIAGVPGCTTQVRACGAKLVSFAKAENISTILVGHVTKDGSIAGPKTLEHLVDATLSLELSEAFSSHRVLRAWKNRFGSTQEIGVFSMGAKGLSSVERDDDQAKAPSPAPAPHESEITS